MILLTVWGNPIAWKRPGINTKSGHVYDQQSRERDAYEWQIRAQAVENVLTTPLDVEIIFYMDIPKKASKVKKNQMLSGLIHHMHKPDVDNLEKFTLDCMTGIIYKDDAQIVRLTSTKCYSDEPRTVISVRPLTTNQHLIADRSYDSD